MFIKEKSKNDIKEEIVDSIYKIFEDWITIKEGIYFVFNVTTWKNGYPVADILCVDTKNLKKLEGRYNVLFYVTKENISIIEKISKWWNLKEIDSFIKDIKKTIDESELILSYYKEVNKKIKELSKLSSDELTKIKNKYGIFDSKTN